jgi:hypothetical protein
VRRGGRKRRAQGEKERKGGREGEKGRK